MNKLIPFFIFVNLISCADDSMHVDSETMQESSICGDGILSSNEECDDGSDNNCQNCIKPRKIFVSDASYNGLFMDKSNELCLEQAQTANLDEYNWVSWISLSNQNAKDKFYQSPFRYELLDGTIIANNYEELISGNLQHEINVTQFEELIDVGVWTGTDEFGIYSEYNCNNWTNYRLFGTIGSTSDKDLKWTKIGIKECTMNLHIYCIEDKKL